MIFLKLKAWGFTPKAKKSGPAPAPAAETTQEKLTRIAKGQEEGFSLSQAAGARVQKNNGFDAKTLANMSEEDFAAFVEKAKKSDMRSVFGE